MPLHPVHRLRSACVALVTLVAGATAIGAHADPPAGKNRLPAYYSPEPMPKPRFLGDELLATPDFESHPAFGPDGHTMYYVKSSPDFVFHAIVERRFADGTWTTPQIVSFSGKYNDSDPFVTADGAQLFFVSDRPLQDYIGAERRPDRDVWVVDRVGDSAWSAPRNVGAPVNGPGNEWHPALAADGTLYFGSDRPGGRGATDLYRCRPVNRSYGPAENLGDSVNTAADEIEPWIAPDQSYMIFTARGRPDSRGGTDLYVSYARGSGWSAPANLGEVVNSKRDEYSPLVSPDGEYFFWTSCRSFADYPIDEAFSYPGLLTRLRHTVNGLGDIYQIDRSALGLSK